MQPPIIKIKNVWFAYNRQPVLKEVSFNIRQGEFLAIIGPNGGGKTTLLKLMLGLIKPDRGDIRVLERTPPLSSPAIGYVPQDVHINNRFPISALDVVLMGRLHQGHKMTRHSAKNRRDALEAMDKMGMNGYHNQRIGELSGGQRQRIFIARALVTNPKILFLDEPTASIDTHGQADFFDLLKSLNRNITIVMVSHDLMMLSSHVKSVACVNQSVHYHDEAEITDDMVDMYHCPVELIAHGFPHRVLKKH